MGKKNLKLPNPLPEWSASICVYARGNSLKYAKKWKKDLTKKKKRIIYHRQTERKPQRGKQTLRKILKFFTLSFKNYMETTVLAFWEKFLIQKNMIDYETDKELSWKGAVLMRKFWVSFLAKSKEEILEKISQGYWILAS